MELEKETENRKQCDLHRAKVWPLNDEDTEKSPRRGEAIRKAVQAIDAVGRQYKATGCIPTVKKALRTLDSKAKTQRRTMRLRSNKQVKPSTAKKTDYSHFSTPTDRYLNFFLYNSKKNRTFANSSIGNQPTEYCKQNTDK